MLFYKKKTPSWMDERDKGCNDMKKFHLIVGVLMLCLLAACAGGDPDMKETSADGENGKSKDGGNVSMPIEADPLFNPWHPNAYAESNIVNRIIFQGLTKPGLDNLPAPNLAEEWTASDDGLVWTFNLRDDVKWHDGEEFSANDVAFTFNDIVLNEDLGANGSSNYKALEKVEVVDDHTVKFHLKRPFASLPAYLAFNSEILPEHKFSDIDDPWDYTEFNKKEPVGTGPFKVEDYTSGQSVKLARYDDYHNEVANLDSVTFKVLPDTNTQVAQALSDELDMFVLEDKGSLDRVKDADNVDIAPTNTTKYYWTVVNLEDPRFQDLEVRKAMLHAIDREAIIDSVLQGYASIADAAITPDLEQYYNPDVESYDFDPEKAKELLSEAGWEENSNGILEKDGEEFSFTFDVALQGDLEEVATLIQQYLKDVGFDIKLNTMEWNSMVQKNVIERDYDMIINWWTYPPDPDVSSQYHSSNAGTGDNIPGYQSDELDELLEEGQSVTDPDERKEVYDKVQEHMAENLPYLYLWYPEEITLQNKRLNGIPEDISYGFTLHYINEWWVD